MKNIEHIVYLMLENRSFDTILGWLYEDDTPNEIISNDKQKSIFFYGLKENKYFNLLPGSATKYYVQKGVVDVEGDIPVDPCHTPIPDPGETFREVNFQLFKTRNPVDNQYAAMDGFLENYLKAVSRGEKSSHTPLIPKLKQILQTYTPNQLSVLNGLAKNYAVSDYWFSSVPSNTYSNRAFASAGTSLGFVNNHIHLDLLPMTFNTRNIWDVLVENGYSSCDDWMIYHGLIANSYPYSLTQ